MPKVLFLHVPRSAGCSFVLSLKEFYDIHSIVLLGQDRHICCYDINKRLKIDIYSFENYYILMRNPINIFKSFINLAYQVYHDMIYNYKLDPLSVKSPFLNLCYFLVTNYKHFDKLEIVKEIVTTCIPAYENSIFLQQTLPISEKFKVLKYENLEEDFNKFCTEMFGKTTSLIKINGSKFNFYNEFVGDEEDKILDFIREAYKKDLEMFYPEELNDP